jgi:hypothetical protein
MEAGACLDVAKVEEIVSEAHRTEGKELLERLVSMLTKMPRDRPSTLT